MSKETFKKSEFTSDELSRANSADLLQIATMNGLTVKHYSRDTYTTVEHDSLKMTPNVNKWFWKSQDKGGGPIQLMMYLGNQTWVEAVKSLLGSEMEVAATNRTTKHEVKPMKEFELPQASENFKHLYAYLTKSRGINKDIVAEFVKNKTIYESLYVDEEKGYKFSNCTFVGKDKNDIPKYAAVRSTNTGVSFKGEVEGSDKEYAFSKRGLDSCLYTFESPIEMLSFLTLLKNNGNDKFDSHMIANGGVSLLALRRYLEDYKEDANIQDIVVCTNKDEAGHGSYLKVLDEFGERYNVHRLTSTSFDWNNDLTTSLNIETKLKEFKLPINKLNLKFDRIYPYLVDTMNIDKELIDKLIAEKKIYQTIFNNCAFVGSNKEGVDKSAFIVSTNLTGDTFANYTEGSDTTIPFSIPGQGTSVCVFKEPIEMLSYLSLVKHHNAENFINHCISYGNDTNAILNYLKLNPEIRSVILCMNDTIQYEVTSALIGESLENIRFKIHPPKSNCYNDDLSIFLNNLLENDYVP